MKPVDKFGEFIVRNLRDKALEQHAMLQRGELRGARIQEIQQALASFTPEQRAVVSRIVTDVIDTATHDLLFALQDAHDRQLGIEVLVDGANVAEESGMLQGEPLGDRGWVQRFSCSKGKG
jgi:hypothetical protein